MTNFKTTRLLNFLKGGSDITEAQARRRFGIENLSATASYLRGKGYAVYANRKVSERGNEFTAYRIGTPSRKVIAAGYRALREELGRAA